MIKFIDQMNEFVGRIVSVVAVIFAAIIIYDVFMRYALNDPTRWAFDVTKQLYGFYFVMLILQGILFYVWAGPAALAAKTDPRGGGVAQAPDVFV